jgi:hypothetical protein
VRHDRRRPNRRRKNLHGQGSNAAYRPSDGRWSASLPLPNGVEKHFYEKTAAEVTRKRDRARLQIDQGLPLP